MFVLFRKHKLLKHSHNNKNVHMFLHFVSILQKPQCIPDRLTDKQTKCIRPSCFHGRNGTRISNNIAFLRRLKHISSPEKAEVKNENPNRNLSSEKNNKVFCCWTFFTHSYYYSSYSRDVEKSVFSASTPPSATRFRIVVLNMNLCGVQLDFSYFIP